jgi:hypothetical protein
MEASDKVYVDALRVTTRPALVAACGRAALAVLVGLALVLSVWKGLPVTASVIASGGLLVCAARRRPRSQSTITASTTDR